MTYSRVLALCVKAIIATACIAASLKVSAQTVETRSAKVLRWGDSVDVAFTIVAPKLNAKESIVLTPQLQGSADTLLLPSLEILGRRAWYRYRRNNTGGVFLSDYVIWEKDLRRHNSPDTLHYATTVAYQPWMDRAILTVYDQRGDACGNSVALADTTTLYRQQPTITTIDGIHQRNVESLGGRAFVDFIVNRTEIRPDYHDNRHELKKIQSAIDSVCNDTTLRIVRLTIKGYASPEGPYDNNIRLARGRTQALKEYIVENSCVPDSIIVTDYEPEDWEGLREYVDKSNLKHRSQILDIIDSDEEPDARLKRIKDTYFDDYFIILMKCMPWLRHSDYRIDYQRITRFDTPDVRDTTWVLPTAGERPVSDITGRDPHLLFYALKTNLLFDALWTPNAEIEVPFGKQRKWSIMAECWWPWYVWNHNSRAYQFLVIGMELRRWWGKCQPMLTGPFWGVYAAGGKYDWEYGHHSVGDQGEFTSLGATIGYSWAIAPRLNIEMSFSAGFWGGPRRHYHGEFNDTHLIWKYNDHSEYVGPTKAKISLVWLLDWPFKKKGGAL